MTKSNLPTLADLANDPAIAKALTLAEIHALLEEANETRATAEAAKKVICAHLQDANATAIAKAYSAADKQFGVIHVELEGGYDLEIGTDKKVEWNQAGLAELETTIRTAGDDPAEFIKVERKVEEKKYTAWPAMIRKPFEAHRVVKPGSVTVKLAKIAPAELV